MSDAPPPAPSAANARQPQPQEMSNWPFIKRIGLLAVGTALAVYLCWWVVGCSMQDKLLFPAPAAPPTVGTPEGAVRFLWPQREGTGQTEGWLFPAPPALHPAPLVIFFHGNAELIDYLKEDTAIFKALGCNVFLPEYRGYGRSQGRPSQAALREDHEAFYDELITRPEIDPKRVIYYGRSLGGAVAADLARTRPPAALILQSTFASLPEMTREFAFPAFLLKQRFDTMSALREMDIPTLIFHGTLDDVVPIRHAYLLRGVARQPRLVEYECGHNDFPGPGNMRDYLRQLERFLSDLNLLTPRPAPTPGQPTANPPAPTTAPATQPDRPTTAEPASPMP